MGKINYTIGDILKIMNITEGSIRNYEKKGLIKSERNANNKYRYYSYRDLNRIASVRKYRNLGLSLDKIKNLLISDNISDTQSILEDHHRKLIEQANELLENANKINLDIEKINKIEKNLDNFTLIDMPQFYFIHLIKQLQQLTL